MENGEDEIPQFDPEVLDRLKDSFDSISKVTFNPPVSPANPGEGLVMRPLYLSDYDRGFLQILALLTKVGDIPRKMFEEQFYAFKSRPNTGYIIVIEDTTTGQVIGTGTLTVDLKFIHRCAKKGRLDEVVVADTYRGRQLGKLLVETLTLLSQQLGCYKTTLECKTENIPFYSKFGFAKDSENYMTYRHEHCSMTSEEVSG